MNADQQAAFWARVQQATPVDAAALSMLAALGVKLDPFDPATADRYDAFKRAAMKFSALYLDALHDGMPTLHDSSECALLDAAAHRWVRGCLVEEYGDSARYEEQVADCARLMEAAERRADADAKRRAA